MGSVELVFVKNPFEVLERVNDNELLLIPIKAWGNTLSEEVNKTSLPGDLKNLMIDLVKSNFLLGRVRKDLIDYNEELYLLRPKLAQDGLQKILDRLEDNKRYFREDLVEKASLLTPNLELVDLIVAGKELNLGEKRPTNEAVETLMAIVAGVEGPIEVNEEISRIYEKLLDGLFLRLSTTAREVEVLSVAKVTKREDLEEDNEDRYKGKYGIFKTKGGKSVLVSFLDKRDYYGRLNLDKDHILLHQRIKTLRPLKGKVYVSFSTFEVETSEGKKEKVLLGVPIIVAPVETLESSIDTGGAVFEDNKYTTSQRTKETSVVVGEEEFFANIKYVRKEDVETKHLGPGETLEMTIRNYVSVNLSTALEPYHPHKVETSIRITEDGTLDHLSIWCNLSAYSDLGLEEVRKMLKGWGIRKKKFVFSGFIEREYEKKYDIENPRNSKEKLVVKRMFEEEKERVRPATWSLAEYLTKLTKNISEEIEENHPDLGKQVSKVLESPIVEEKREKIEKYLELIKDLCFASDGESVSIKHPVKRDMNYDEEVRLSKTLAMESLGVDPKKLEGDEKSLREVIKISFLCLPFLDEYEYYKLMEEVDKILKKSLRSENIKAVEVRVNIVRDLDPNIKRKASSTKVLVVVEDDVAKVYTQAKKTDNRGRREVVVESVRLSLPGMDVTLKREE